MNKKLSHTLSELRKDIKIEAVLAGQRMEFNTTLGLFSPKEIDEGTRLFLDNVSVKSTDLTLDLGCGYGAIGLTLARLSPEGQVHLIDKDFVAVEYARNNADLNKLKNTKVYLSNGFSHVPEIQFDNIVSNLPAQIGSDLLKLVLEDAKIRLRNGGRIQVVTVSRMREWIKRSFLEAFGNYTKVKQGRMHTVSMAVKE